MAAPSSLVTQLTAITNKYFIPKMHDAIFLGNPLLARAKSKGWYRTIDGGSEVVIPLEYARNGASDWFSGSDTLNVADTDSFTGATYYWKQLYAPINVTRLDELKNMGKAQIVDFVKAKVKNAEKTMRYKLSTGIYSDGSTDADSIVGLVAHVSTSNTIGGISQSANSWHQGQLNSTTTTLTMSAMQTLFNSCSEDDEQPSVLVGTKANFNRYYALLQPQQRFTDASSAKGGFSSLMFNGVPFLSDSNCPTYYLFMLNENHLHLLAHKDEDMKLSEFDEPINQHVKVAKVFWAGIFGSSNNRFQGCFSALTA